VRQAGRQAGFRGVCEADIAGMYVLLQVCLGWQGYIIGLRTQRCCQSCCAPQPCHLQQRVTNFQHRDSVSQKL
jgi:hypothetical protein